MLCHLIVGMNIDVTNHGCHSNTNFIESNINLSRTYLVNEMWPVGFQTENQKK